MKKVFLIEEHGPSEIGLGFRDTVCDQLRQAGHEVIGPWCLTPLRGPGSIATARNEYWYSAWRRVSETLVEAIYRQIDAADALAWLGDAAIGPIVGAAMGYAFARSKSIFVYRSEHGLIQRRELPFDIQLDFMCDESGGLVTDSVSKLVEAVGRLSERPDNQEAA